MRVFVRKKCKRTVKEIMWNVLEDQGYQTEKKLQQIIKIMRVQECAKSMIVMKILTKAP